MATATREQSASSEYSDLTDYHLLGLYLDRKDERAFHELFSRYNSRLLAFATKKVGHRPEAEDIVAQTWRKVHEHLHRFDPDQGTFSTWIYFICANLVKNAYRNRDRDPQTSFSTLTKNRNETDRPIEFEDAGSSPERVFEKTRARKLVEDAVRKLRPHHRVTFVLVNLRGWTYRRTARWLGLALGTIKSRQHRAEAAFAKAFGEIAEQRVTPEGGRVRVTNDGSVQWSRPEDENGASPWSLRGKGNDADDEDAGTRDPDEIRVALREQDWTLEDGTWRQTGNRRARVFLDEFVDEFPGLVTRWFLPE